MRIAYVTETWPPEVNGVSLTAARSVAWLRDAGHVVQLVRPRQRGEPVRDDQHEWRTRGGPIPLYPDLRFGLAGVGTLRRRWRRFAPALVHAATPGPLGWAALRAARLEGIPTSADYRTHFHAYSRHYGLGWCEAGVLAWLRRLHAQADCNFVPTVRLARQLARQGFERLTVVGRGVDAAAFTPARRDPALRREWRAAAEHRVLLHVGRLAPEKNVQLALDTFEHLRLRTPGLRMVVLGDGPLRRRLEAAHPAVHFAGQQTGDALARHYASADVFLFPSLTDTFGNVVLEAMASGLALVAFDAAAAGAHVNHGLNGLLAPPNGGARGFADAAAEALLHADPESALRHAARVHALRQDWAGVLQRFERRLLEVAAAREPVPAHAALA